MKLAPCPPPSGSFLTEAQRSIVFQLVDGMKQANFERSKLLDTQQDMVARLATVCQSDEEFLSMAQELECWVRWYRLPAYWLTFLFQLVTQQAKSVYHILSCRLYSEAQINIYEGLFLPSLENAYRILIQIRAIEDNEALRKLDADLQDRLASYHAFYMTWLKPFSYLDCNPLTEHPYGTKTRLDLILAFPELNSTSLAEVFNGLHAIIEQCHEEDYLYYRILARRFLGSLSQGNNDIASAIEQFRQGLEEAVHIGLDTEIGHFHRLYGYALYKAGHFQEAIQHYEKAFGHESSPECAYWQALSARELGDVRAALVASQGVDLTQEPDRLQSAMGAYHGGRLMFEAHLEAQILPMDRAIKQQLFRSYAGNALQVASFLNSPLNVLAEGEANGPHQATEVLAEIVAALHPRIPASLLRQFGTRSSEVLFETVAAQKKAESSLAEFRRAREIFHRHLSSIPEKFEDYLASFPQENEMRQHYMRTRIDITKEVTYAQLSDHVAQKILELRLPGVVFLLFDIGWQKSTVILLDVGAGEVIARPASFTERDLRVLYQEYQQALEAADVLPDPGVITRKALDRLLVAYENLLGPFLEPLIPFLKNRHLKIFPRFQMNAVPLHALNVGGKRLVEHCQVSYGQTLGLFLALHTEYESDQISPVAMVYGSQGTPFFEGTLESMKPTYRETLFVMRNPAWQEFLTSIADHQTADLFFACHGNYYPDTPAASCLWFGSPEGISFSRLFAELDLRNYRSVTLGACQSGLARSEIAFEYVGLPSAFLAAGVRYVTGSLWKVNQLATAMLLSRYFELLKSGQYTPPAALNSAQRQMLGMTQEEVLAWVQHYLSQYASRLEPLIEKMDAKPFAHPDYWAGFYVSGDI